jgi:hypothetical protein
VCKCILLPPGVKPIAVDDDDDNNNNNNNNNWENGGRMFFRNLQDYKVSQPRGEVQATGQSCSDQAIKYRGVGGRV